MKYNPAGRKIFPSQSMNELRRRINRNISEDSSNSTSDAPTSVINSKSPPPFPFSSSPKRKSRRPTPPTVPGNPVSPSASGRLSSRSPSPVARHSSGHRGNDREKSPVTLDINSRYSSAGGRENKRVPPPPPTRRSVAAKTTSTKRETSLSNSKKSMGRTSFSEPELSATSALSETLHPGWVALRDDDGRLYYYNQTTKQSQWDVYPGWVTLLDDEGKQYYYNQITKQSQWERPNCMPLADSGPVDTIEQKRLFDTDESRNSEQSTGSELRQKQQISSSLHRLESHVEGRTLETQHVDQVEHKGYLSFRHNVLTQGKWHDFYCLYNRKAKEIKCFLSRMDLSNPIGTLNRSICRDGYVQLLDQQRLEVVGIRLKSEPKSSPLVVYPVNASRKLLLRWKIAFEAVGCTGGENGAGINAPYGDRAGNQLFAPSRESHSDTVSPRIFTSVNGGRTSTNFHGKDSSDDDAVKARQSSPGLKFRKSIPITRKETKATSYGMISKLASGLLNNFIAKRVSKEELLRRGVLKQSEMFHKQLAYCRKRNGISEVLLDCVEVIREKGLSEEGIFRIPGSMSEINMLKKLYDYEAKDTNLKDKLLEADINAVAGLLKLFLREMPDPLLTYDLYPDLLDMARKKNFNQVLPTILARLPELEGLCFRFLFHFLKEASFFSSESKMTASNLAIVFSPNVLRAEKETLAILQRDAKHKNLVIETAILATQAEMPDISQNLNSVPFYANLFEEGAELDEKYSAKGLLGNKSKTTNHADHLSNRFGQSMNPILIESLGEQFDEKLTDIGICDMLKEGGIFKKFKNAASRRGERQRIIWSTGNLARIVWSDTVKENTLGYIDSHSIQQVAESANNGIKIVCSARTLELEASSKALQRRWIRGLRWLQQYAYLGLSSYLKSLDKDKKYLEQKVLQAKKTLEILRRGQTFSKYKTNYGQKVHSRHFWCDSGFRFLQWSDPADRTKIRNYVEMNDICCVVRESIADFTRFSILSARKCISLTDHASYSDNRLRDESNEGCVTFVDALDFYLNQREIFFTPNSEHCIVES